MENNINQKTELKQKFFNILNDNKFKIYILLCTLIIIIAAIITLNIIKEKKNYLIAEKYVAAGLYLKNNNNEKSKNLYEEIILSKNKFYAILSLNTIIEKNLISDDKTIISYFNLLENMDLQEKKFDLITIKKALFYLKISKKNEGINLLEKLIKKNSKFKSLAEEIIIE